MLEGAEAGGGGGGGGGYVPIDIPLNLFMHSKTPNPFEKLGERGGLSCRLTRAFRKVGGGSLDISQGQGDPGDTGGTTTLRGKIHTTTRDHRLTHYEKFRDGEKFPPPLPFTGVSWTYSPGGRN
jgi:hypothetical protein